MDENYITVRSGKGSKKNPKKSKNSEITKEGMSLRTKLVVVLLVVLFIALNGIGYYLYMGGYFGIGADISSQTIPSQKSIKDNKRDAIFMIPEAP